MISIKEYAKRNNVSYEAIRKQLKRYENELSNHIIKKNRTQFLDNEAVAILDSHRKESPTVIYNQDISDEIERLKQENHNLLIKIASQADKIAELNEWKANNSLLIAEAGNNKKLLDNTTKELERTNEAFFELDQEKKSIEKELAITKDELEKERNKSFFARLFRK